EIVKPVYGGEIDKATLESTILFFDKLLRLLHPFMPFLTEELWQNLTEREKGESIMVSSQPDSKSFNGTVLEKFALAKDAIAGVRNIRQSKGISPKESLDLHVKGNLDAGLYTTVRKMANIGNIYLFSQSSDLVSGASFMSGTTEFFVPLEGLTDISEEIKKAEAELDHLHGFLKSVNAKLGNEKFVANAPGQVVEMEKKKQSDAQTKISALEKLIQDLKKQ
ncbi:MAG: class I tRNA ligase family protein, partial [Bacteroidales bacterium]